MTEDRNINSIGTVSQFWTDLEKTYRLSDDLLCGTRAMRLGGELWLPRFAAEKDEEYQWRLNNAVLRNILGRSRDKLIGQMFRDGIDKSKLKLDKKLADDFDMLGTSIDKYACDVAGFLMTHGIAHTFVDFPRVEGGRTLAQEQKENIRPYALMIKPRDLRFAVAQHGAGKPRLQDVRWWITEYEPTGLGEQHYHEVRRLRIVKPTDKPVKVRGEVVDPGKPGDVVYEIWRSYGDGKDTEVTSVGDFGLIAFGALKGVTEIPLRTAYATYEAFMRSTPVLESVAQKNAEHWRASSDHNSIIQMSRFPMFYATGLSEEEVRMIDIVGPHKRLASTNPQATFGYAETNGSAVSLSFQDLERIVRDADQQSIEALYRPGGDTATGRIIDNIESLSPAQRCAMETERHLNQVLKDFGRWLNRDVGEVKVPIDFGYSENEQLVVAALQAARASGDIPRPYYLKRLQQIGVIGDDVNPDELAAEADNEQAERGLNSNFGDDEENEDDQPPTPEPKPSPPET